MPIYEYQCTGCGHQLEVLQKMTDAPLTQCPVCHQSQLTKIISAAGFQLKGSGWYATDYSKKGQMKAKAENHQADNTTPAADSKSDTNTAAKPSAEDKT